MIHEKVKCIKSLYKSTYLKNAFTKGKEYSIVDKDKDMFYLIDNNGNEFNFSINSNKTYYSFNDYFKIK